MANDSRDEIDALLEMSQLKWNFDNPTVTHYRAGNIYRGFEDSAFSAWHIPQFFSEQPIQPNVNSVTAVVRLPVRDDAPLTHTRVSITSKKSHFNGDG